MISRNSASISIVYFSCQIVEWSCYVRKSGYISTILEWESNKFVDTLTSICSGNCNVAWIFYESGDMPNSVNIGPRYAI